MRKRKIIQIDIVVDKKKKSELDDVDVVLESKPLTESEKKSIREFIAKDKAKDKKETVSRKGPAFPRV